MAFAVSQGALQAIHRPTYQAPTSLRLSDDYTAAYEEIYRKHSSVRTVIDFLARAMPDLHVYERVSDTDRARVTDHPFAKLLARPNSYTTAFRMKRALVSDRSIYGYATWLKTREGGEPALVRLPPSRCKPGGNDDWLRPEYFEVTGSRGKTQIAPENVVYFRGYHPTDDRMASSPLESLRQALAEEWAASQMRDQVLRNGARMSGYIERPAGGRWSDDAFERFKDDWRAQYTGNGPEAGGTPILEDGMKFIQASMTPEQLQYVEVRKLSREEVAAAYHIPPPMVGLLDKATFSNITEQHKMLYQDTLPPWTTEFEQDIELQLMPDFPGTESFYVEFNLAEKLRGTPEEQAQQFQTLVGAPVMTRGEARARLNLPEIEGTDELVTPLNVLLGGQASPRDSAPDGGMSWRIPSAKNRSTVRVKDGATQGQRDKARDVLAKFYARQESVIRSILGAKADEDWWDEDRWNDELAADLYAVSFLVSTQVAAATLERLGLPANDYDAELTLNYLATVARSTSESINAVTRQKIADALADAEDPVAEVAHVFEVAKEARSEQGGYALVAAIAGFAAVEAIHQVAANRRATKTWIVTSGNPRPSHAAMDGETVDLDSTFSNGAKWPGDAVLDVDEIAGCTCDVEITFP